MLGGGTFTTQNKVLVGAYINFVSALSASASLSDRGVAALPLELDWGVDDAIFTVTADEFQKNSLKIFGYDYASAKMKPLRDLFKNIKTAHLFKLMNGGVAASNTFCNAKFKGIRGNDLRTVVVTNVDDGSKMDVSTFLGTVLVDKQTVLPNTNNLIANDFVTWKTNVTLTLTAGLSLTTGANGSAVTTTQYQSFLDKVESYQFNALGCPTVTTAISDLFVAFTKRLRDQVGAKFQTVVYRSAADYEGVINVHNDVTDTNAASLVYWVTGVAAGCEINKSNTNKLYDGEYAINVSLKQSELEANILAGKFTMHKVGSDVRVLDDVNSLVTTTAEKGIDFKSNQTIRVLDQIANDVAVLFNTKYLGQIPNDASGRIAFWNDVVSIHQQLQTIRAIENFKSDDIVVEKGATKKSVVVNGKVTPTNAMGQLYMTTVVQ